MTTQSQNGGIHVPCPGDMDYGEVQSVLRPVRLPLGCVLENRALKTESYESKVLFKTSLVFLQMVLDSLESKDLASFALLNRECRQLARSRQFCAVSIDISPRSWGIVKILCHERLEREKSNNGVVSFPTLGACIRGISVKIQDNFTGMPIKDPSLEHRLDCPQTYRVPLGDYNERAIYDIPFELRKILCCQWTLPYLETLKWNLNYCFDNSLVRALARPSLQNLILFDVSVDKMLAAIHHRRVTLRTLFVKPHQTDIEGRTYPLCLLLLEHSAPTIECLVWHGLGVIDCHLCLRAKLLFPQLCNLYLRQASPSISILTSLLQSEKLRNLRIDYVRPMNDTLRNFFDTYGRIETLETFSFSTPHVGFLRANNQLSNINFDSTRAGRDSIKESVMVLEILDSSQFNNLTSLGIQFSKKEEDFPKTALTLIGRLTQLKQLLISNDGGIFAPATDHDMILNSLNLLVKLEKVVIEGDVYQPDSYHRPVQYYTATYASDKDTFDKNMSEEEISKAKSDPKAGKPYWQLRHGAKMRKITIKYKERFQQLKFLYVGKGAFCFASETDQTPWQVYSSSKLTFDFFTGEMFHMAPWDRLHDGWT
ncbi:hypothetical protein sscle_14g101720 [Sclerotinia sclerotiorum 1980 UF-70]|uniref:F-box domain-containing protein n=1 Tax=Sclerotinia sclerotiorum (strain ATCC 18683 / 1980 / Ss-1) TaxID=665079 RepID=A0A1D9QKS1_SCLS1|nr:hypothetical protein sscle_14g101720 [Sclerotinia sclerotiorum 1980 UF-70]